VVRNILWSSELRLRVVMYGIKSRYVVGYCVWLALVDYVGFLINDYDPPLGGERWWDV
jgi:hypothetical protein